MYEQVSRVAPQPEPDCEAMRPLSLTQRLNRLRYCCYTLTGSVIVSLIAALLMIYTRATFMPGAASTMLMAALVGLILASMVWFIGLLVRRLHDTDRTGWWVLLAFVPVLNFLLLLYLLLAPGTAGANRFGAPNPGNGPLVVVFGGLWWTLQVLGVLANIILLGSVFMAPGQFADWQAEFRQQIEQQMQQQGMELPRPGPGSG